MKKLMALLFSMLLIAALALTIGCKKPEETAPAPAPAQEQPAPAPAPEPAPAAPAGK